MEVQGIHPRAMKGHGGHRVRIDSVRAVFPLPCDVTPALTCGHSLFRDFSKSRMAGHVARTLVLTLKVSLTLWTLRILECSLCNCPLVSKEDWFQDPCGHPSSRVVWPSRRTVQHLSTTCLCTWIRRSARRGANSGFVLGNFLHFLKIIFEPRLVEWTRRANCKYTGCSIPVHLSIQNYFRLSFRDVCPAWGLRTSPWAKSHPPPDFVWLRANNSLSHF